MHHSYCPEIYILEGEKSEDQSTLFAMVQCGSFLVTNTGSGDGGDAECLSQISLST